MEFTIKRKKCSSSFERTGLGAIQGVPESEISAVVDKVEAAADHFKYRKCFRRTICLYFIILLLGAIGCAVHHLRHRRFHSKGPHGPLGGQNFHGGAMPTPMPGPGPVRGGPLPPDNQAFPNKSGPVREPKPWERGCWKRRHDQPDTRHKRRVEEPEQKPSETTEVAPAPPTDPEVPEEPNTNQSSNPRKLQQADSTGSSPAVDLPATGTASSSTSTAEPATLVDPMPSSGVGAPGVSTPGFPGQTEPDYPRRHRRDWKPWRHWRHWRPHWRRGGHMMRGQGPQSPDHRGFRRHHGRRVFKAVFFFLIVPLLLFLGLRCAKKRVARRVRQILDIENRRFREKYGCEWSTNNGVNKLTLRRLGAPVQVHQAPLGYPTQPVYPVMVERTPFCEQAEPAPLFTETGPAHSHRHEQTRRGYQRVSLDDSTIGYNYQ